MSAAITLLDGGMGRELERMGAPFRQPEWSALPLLEGPDYVRRAHAAFIAAGAQVITANSYAVVPFHLGEERFAAKGLVLADRAGRLARQAADAAPGGIRVAGSLPPLFGSYRPDLFDAARAPALLTILVRGLSPHVDLWLGETLSAIAEADAVATALAGDPRPLWLSFTLRDGEAADPARPCLRSGESVAEAARAARRLGAKALLFNCSQPEVMAPALRVARDTLGGALPLGVYANAFPPQRQDAEANATLLPIRADLTPEGYRAFARAWAEAGATLIGGCCGIGPEHIGCLHEAVVTRGAGDK
jgi:S-methylmethionine-dependent homocysteine/selenocysteine methylase